MTDRAAVLRRLEALPASKLAAAAHLLDYLQAVDPAEAEQWPNTLEGLRAETTARAFQRAGAPSALYDTDFYTWTQTQAAALRAKDFAALDLAPLAEEIEDVGNNIRFAIESQLVRLLLHLLKLAYGAATRPRRGWMVTVDSARDEIAKRATGGLRDHPARSLAEAYRKARRKALLATGRPPAAFPEECPWTVEQVMDTDFFPEAEPR